MEPPSSAGGRGHMTARADGAYELFNRAAELAVLQGFLTDPSASAFVVRGGPGSGRTALVEEAIRRASDSVDTIRISGRASGSAKPYSAVLANLDGIRQQRPSLRPWVDVVEQVVVRHARAADRSQPEDAAALASEIGSVLSEVERPVRPTVVVVDDLDAADPFSQHLVAVCADRAGPFPWSYLITTEADVPMSPHHPGVELGGLATAGVRALLEPVTGHSIPLPVAAAIHQATGGMPLAVREVASRLTADELRGLEPLPVPLPATDRLNAAYGPVFDDLDPAAVAAVAMFSCRPTIPLEAFAAAVGGIDTVEELIRRDLLEWHGDSVAPGPHTQLAVAWSRSTLSELSTVARTLVAESRDDEERLVYELVDPASRPEEWVERLIGQLRNVTAGGAHARLAALSEYRLGDSVDTDLLLALALAYEGVGATAAAERILDRLQRLDPRGSTLVSLHTCRARIGGLHGYNPADYIGSSEVLVPAGPDDPAPTVDTRVALAALYTFQDQAELARVELEQATAAAGSVAAGSRRRAELMKYAVRVRSGREVDLDEYRSAITSQVNDGLWDSWIYIVAFARDLLAVGDPRTARRLLKRRLTAPMSAVECCAYLAALAEVEVWCGRFGRALELVREVDSRLPSTASDGLNLRGILLWCSAATGDGAELLARYDSDPQVGVGRVQIYTRAVAAGYAHLAAGRYTEAADVLLIVMRNAHAVPHLVAECLTDLVDALVAAGDLTSARLELKQGREQLIETTSARTRHLLKRCDVLTTVADPASDAYAMADADDGVGDAIRIRTLVAHARALAGTGRSAEALERLGRAAQIARLWGLDGWLAEIDRLRTTEPEYSGPWNQLTADERRIVAMVVNGARNKEIAAELYVSLRTAEAALTRIFRTVGVSNRGELIALASRSGIFGDAEPAARRPSA